MTPANLPAPPAPPAPGSTDPFLDRSAWRGVPPEAFRALLGRVPGLWAVDKPGGPGGMTSHDVVDRARGAFGVRRIGHAGTLDPTASGLLLLAVGREATRLLPFLVGLDKSYEATVRLGVRTDSFDLAGRVLETREARVSIAELEAALAGFRGTIRQVPPGFSALKRGGEPAYARARRGEAVELAPREVTISRLDLVAFEPPEVRIELDCSKGTYVRSLAEDLGRALGCGAALAALRRTRIGPFTLADALPLEALGAGRAPPPSAL